MKVILFDFENRYLTILSQRFMDHRIWNYNPFEIENCNVQCQTQKQLEKFAFATLSQFLLASVAPT